MRDKWGAMGEGVLMILRLVLVSIIAFAIFGVSSIFYAYHVEVRDAEAVILTRQVSECLSPEGVLNLDNLFEDPDKGILSYCGFSFNERFYVGVKVFDGGGNLLAELSQGDSGASWIRELTGGAGKYDIGYRAFEYPVLIDGVEGKIKIEVVVKNEF